MSPDELSHRLGVDFHQGDTKSAEIWIIYYHYLLPSMIDVRDRQLLRCRAIFTCDINVQPDLLDDTVHQLILPGIYQVGKSIPLGKLKLLHYR